MINLAGYHVFVRLVVNLVRFAAVLKIVVQQPTNGLMVGACWSDHINLMTFDSPGAMTRPSVGESLAADALERRICALRVCHFALVVAESNLWR